ncbi:MAG: DJ-1/PfpI family protein, partial [Bacteroidota bacterium]
FLNEQPYCTHHLVYDHLQELVPSGIPQKDKRFVNSGKIYTSGGISAGIDVSFHIVEKLHGKAIAEKTATYMEYDRRG